ncbi:hypothetical protein [Streptomyces poonensis]|uniref:Uncharacterized protein n=1 Tax=Streptomyces poonensis TaxID=68255 RepID=A0A918Q5B9_9ACTN|nr:hypothetical protein [Streptomyces poonensis]GGZ32353.1 hypothetical protein GCM10010365_61420 [Streptomyces poonensis]GLJ92811.1 hypothetical protein GCM10017589_54210 [Streptomyces poonensis]
MVQRTHELRVGAEHEAAHGVQLMLDAVARHGRDSAPGLWKRYLTLILDGLRNDRGRPTPLPHPALSQAEFDQAMT